jgi:hypothetical protein
MSATIEHYCHNCHYHAELPDGTHCTWCLTFFYRTRKLPKPGDTKPTGLQRLYAELDALCVAV